MVNCGAYSKENCYFFLKEGGNITGHLICTNYKVSSIPAGGVEVPLLLTFSVKSERIFELMKSFVNDLYKYDYTREQPKNTKKRALTMKKLIFK